LIQGVRDPLGGINSLWPLFGIANQMLAAIALCLGTTIILKMMLRRTGVAPVSNFEKTELKFETGATPVLRSPWLALITLIPLVWLLTVTFTAGAEKIWHPDPRIGFLAAAKDFAGKQATVEQQLHGENEKWTTEMDAKARSDVKRLRTLRNNNLLDAAVTGTFLALVAAIILMSIREWILLLSKRKPAVLCETEPVWLPDYALKESGPNLRSAAGAATLALGLARELSGETQFERAKQQACVCEQHSDKQVFAQVTKERFNGVRRCC
jgi:carbon starvation protein